MIMENRYKNKGHTYITHLGRQTKDIDRERLSYPKA